MQDLKRSPAIFCVICIHLFRPVFFHTSPLVFFVKFDNVFFVNYAFLHVSHTARYFAVLMYLKPDSFTPKYLKDWTLLYKNMKPDYFCEVGCAFRIRYFWDSAPRL